MLTSLPIISCSSKISDTLSHHQQQHQEKGNFFVLGDSLSDIGAGSLGQTALLSNNSQSRLKGVKLNSPFFQNSWSNGPIAAQVVANKLNVNLTPAWRFSLNGEIYEQVGNNYAFGGEIVNYEFRL